MFATRGVAAIFTMAARFQAVGDIVSASFPVGNVSLSVCVVNPEEMDILASVLSERAGTAACVCASLKIIETKTVFNCFLCVFDTINYLFHFSVIIFLLDNSTLSF